MARGLVGAGLFALCAAVVASVLVAVPAAADSPPAPTPHSHADAKPVHPTRRSCTEPARPGHATCHALMRTDVPGDLGLAAAGPEGYGPTDLRDAYDLPADAGDGALVAIVDAYDHPYAEADLAVYRQQFGLPPCTSDTGCLTKVNQRGERGDYPRPDAGWAQEISLDLDMVSAACPRCRLLLVEGDSTSLDDLGQAVNTAVRLGARYVSNSYGTSPEGAAESRYDAYYDHAGVAITASTGDHGYGVAYPAASPLVTAVGGTSMVPDGSDRGWAETAWAGAGSGCSRFEPKPVFQTDPECPNRTVADVSAVADPETGVAMYDSYAFQGWAVFGGTSASAPLIAATYALAGEPAAGTRPNAYPYDRPGSLHDVTAGDNGDCGRSYLCSGAAGYDGPTGLGTPNGVAAFTTGPHGTLSGRVTDTHRHPVVGARVTAAGKSAVTAADGRYTLPLLAGEYDVTAAAFGYRGAGEHVVVGDGSQPTVDFRLAKLPTETLSGTVRDGFGHGWPLYAKLTIDGVPGGPVFTDPTTGRYRIRLPRSASYDVHVEAVDTGYRAEDVAVTLGRHGTTANVDLDVDPAECAAAAGYAYRYTGLATDFGGWTGREPQEGWTVTDGKGQGDTWAFDDPGGRGNLTGGAGEFAVLDADAYGSATSYDSALVSPAADLSTVDDPVVGFRTDYRGDSQSRVSVDLSTDGGGTWTSVWRRNTGSENGAVEVPIPQAAGEPDVRVRFTYAGFWAWWWQLDDVYVGARTCEPVAGGLVAGVVRDANTHRPLTGATVGGADTTAVSLATPQDPAQPDGLYRLFLPTQRAGRQSVTASSSTYRSDTERVWVRANHVARRGFSLAAGRVRVRPGSVTLGRDRSAWVTITNDGAVPAHVVLGEEDAGTTTKRVDAAVPVRRVRGEYSPRRHAAVPAGAAAPPYAGPWRSVADYPITITDHGAAELGGKIYSVGGYDGTGDVRSAYRYDPVAGTWTAIADLPVARDGMQVAAIAGRLYVSGGWGPDGTPLADTQRYDPATDTWTRVADNPRPRAFAASAVLDGRLYVVGGCTEAGCTPTVMMYDPVADVWTSAARYPASVSFHACGAVGGRLYCAGGLVPDPAHGGALPTDHGYGYDPATGEWAPIPDMPHDFWGASYGSANGELLVSGGVILSSTTLTNEGVAYDPVAGAWHALPNSRAALFRGAAACGFYKIGGGTSDDDPAGVATEVLPGYDRCGAGVDWLNLSRTELTVPPHRRVTVRLTATPPVGSAERRAWLLVSTDTPYPVAPVEVR